MGWGSRWRAGKDQTSEVTLSGPSLRDQQLMTLADYGWAIVFWLSMGECD
jgi:hypothetical protein